MTNYSILTADLNYKFSSNETFRNGIFKIGMPTAINPTILTIIENEYKIVSGNTNEYHPINSPNPKRPRPTATKRVVFLFPWIYDIKVSIDP